MDNWTNQYLKEHLRKLTKESVWFGLHNYNGWKHIDGKLLGNGYQDWGPGILTSLVMVAQNMLRSYEVK